MIDSNPVALGKWLYEECSRYGVEFLMGTQAVHAVLSDSNQLISLDLASGNEKRTTLRADNLVLAADPWGLDACVIQDAFPEFVSRYEASHRRRRLDRLRESRTQYLPSQ